MILYLLRHGIAEDHGARSNDADRELTAEGKEKTRRSLLAVRSAKIASPVCIISSPYVRARQTAEIAREVFEVQHPIIESTALVPSADIIRTMSLATEHLKPGEPLLFVGHEPHLSTFASALLGSAVPIVEMKKAAFASFDIHRSDPFRMRGYLTALFPPSIRFI